MRDSSGASHGTSGKWLPLDVKDEAAMLEDVNCGQSPSCAVVVVTVQGLNRNISLLLQKVFVLTDDSQDETPDPESVSIYFMWLIF